MKLNSEKVNLSKIKRQKAPPYFDFIEQILPESTVYQVSGKGYFLVAPDKSLVPRFIIETSIPNLATWSQNDVFSLIFEMNERSSGFLWFDDRDFDSYYLTWRARLPVRPSTLLFSWDKDIPEVEAISDYVVKTATPETKNKNDIVELLTSFSSEHGGQTEDAAEYHIKENNVVILEIKGVLAGAALLYPQPSNFVTVTIVIAPKWRGQGLDKWFLGRLCSDLANKGKTAIGGFHNTEFTMVRTVMELGLPVITKGWTAQLGQI